MAAASCHRAAVDRRAVASVVDRRAGHSPVGSPARAGWRWAVGRPAGCRRTWAARRTGQPGAGTRYRRGSCRRLGWGCPRKKTKRKKHEQMSMIPAKLWIRNDLFRNGYEFFNFQIRSYQYPFNSSILEIIKKPPHSDIYNLH